MRRLITLSKERQATLNTIFPEVIEQTYGYEGSVPGYSWFSISIFDHWLSADEHYLIDDIPRKAHMGHLEKLHSFTRKIVDKTEVLTFRCKGRKKRKPIFKKFATQETANRYCEGSTNLTASYNLYVIALPEYECIIKESRDYTNHIYYRNRELLDALLVMAKNCGLNTINELNQNKY